MTIYHVGTEDIHFIHIGGVGTFPNPDVITGSDFGEIPYREEWSRCGLRSTWTPLGDSGTGWRGPLSNMPLSLTEFWLTCRLHQASSNGAQTDLIGFNEVGIRRLALKARPGAKPILYRVHDDEIENPPHLHRDTLAIGLFPIFRQSRLGRIDIYCNLITGVFKLYLDFAVAITFTGDLTNGEFSAIDSYDLLGSNGNAIWSEVCLRSDDTRKMIGIRDIWPYADGAALDWTGIKDDVDEVAVDESDANYTSILGVIQEYKTPPLPPNLTGNTIVGAVMVGARMSTDPTNEAVVVRTDGSDFLSSDFDTDGAIEDGMYIWETNPNTSSQWTTNEISDPDFNIGVAST